MLFYQRQPSEAFLYHRIILCAKEIHRISPMDLNIYSPKRNPCKMFLPKPECKPISISKFCPFYKFPSVYSNSLGL
jgi:hypothetical protein